MQHPVVSVSSSQVLAKSHSWSHASSVAEKASLAPLDRFATVDTLDRIRPGRRVFRCVRAVAAQALSCMPIPAFVAQPRVPARDWQAYPAVVDLPRPEGDLYAVSDVHGDPDRLMHLLERHGIVKRDSKKSDRALWCGGRSILVVVGDSIDKGPSSIGVIDLLRDLEAQAHRAQGRVVVLMGNHEAEFLADPTNKKASAKHGINREIHALGFTPEQFARDDNERGHWLRSRPFGARVGDWFFAHGGDTKGRSFCALDQYLEKSVDKDGFSTSALVGHASILRARNWYNHDAHTGARYSAAIGTEHIVFGHDPGGLGPKGRIAVGQGGSLLRIDTGMSRGVDYSHGALLRVRYAKGRESVHTCAANGEEQLLWSGEKV